MPCEHLTTKNINDELFWWCKVKKDYASYLECTRKPCTCGKFEEREGVGEMIKKYNYRGCGNCPLIKEMPKGECIKKYRWTGKIKIIKPVLWDNWGRMVSVFKIGDVVEGEGVLKDNVLYCCGAESTIYKGVKDYIDLRCIELLK